MQSRYATTRMLLRFGLVESPVRAPAQEARAHWATLRADRLAQRAAQREERDRVEANGTWPHSTPPKRMRVFETARAGMERP